jgi:hypothetical protein
MSTSTPWGTSDYSKKIARGIIFYGTTSHGGFHVSKKLNLTIDPIWRRADGWYEEDCEFCKVYLTFPQYFPPDSVRQAHYAAKSWYGAAYNFLISQGLISSTHQ